MSHVSYSLRRVFWFVWRWQADYDWGQRFETGLSLRRAAARWKGRARLREAQKRHAPAAGGTSLRAARNPGRDPHVMYERRRACAATEAVDPAGCGAIRDNDVHALRSVRVP